MDHSRLPITVPLYESLIRRCANPHSLEAGRSIHAHILRHGYGGERFLLNSLVEMYCKCDSLRDATAVFELVARERIAFPWNILIAANAQRGQSRESIALYRRMSCEGVKPNAITLVSVLGACANLEDLKTGREIHRSHVLGGRSRPYERPMPVDAVMATALVTMYGRCGSVADARAVFEGICGRDLAAWNAMVAAYSRNGQMAQAVLVLRRMAVEGVRPGEGTFVGMLSWCCTVGALDEARSIHAHILATGLESRPTVGTTLVSMYGRCGSLGGAVCAFQRIRDKDIVAWNAMIAAYAQSGHSRDSIRIYHVMDLEGVRVDKVTLIGVLDACSSLALTSKTRLVHARIVDTGVELDVVLGTALVNAYARGGHLVDADLVFAEMEERNVATWSAMVAAYAQTGHPDRSLEMYREMQLQGLRPNYITYVSILFACNHAGLLDHGLDYFASMGRDYGIESCEEHCSCIVDLLGRSGRLDEAEALMASVPYRLGISAWMCLLGACRTHGDVERGARVARRAFQVESGEVAPYVALSNMYAGHGMWDEVSRVRQLMANTLDKSTGKSFVEIDGRLHEFIQGDETHPEKDSIQAKILELELDSPTVPLFHCLHSEKVAVAFAMLKTSGEIPLRVVSSLGICHECHAFMKGISKRCRREIVVRDAEMLHRFDGGSCSCGR
ncbi:hypothetical protein SELMODRAFT_115083 [Selaginella moellendorffii]|uniref:DYW domain-containing protein n=2 Tax=Selaginella moellendorffii TaxID=88036 RepID=D8SE77_SELML|nr:hypothetical protein SELMODRAFT_115083 [Selaginella moellendorffii]